MSAHIETEHDLQADSAVDLSTAGAGKATISLENCRSKADIDLAKELLAKAKQLPATRAERARQLRLALLAGTYDEDSALDGALDSLLDELGDEST